MSYQAFDIRARNLPAGAIGIPRASGRSYGLGQFYAGRPASFARGFGYYDPASGINMDPSTKPFSLALNSAVSLDAIPGNQFQMSGVSPVGPGGPGGPGGCGSCAGGCNGCAGLGALDITSITDSITGAFSGGSTSILPLAGLAVGGYFLWKMFSGSGGGRRKRLLKERWREKSDWFKALAS